MDWNPIENDEIAFIKHDGNWGVVTNFLKEKPNKTDSTEKETNQKVRSKVLKYKLFVFLKKM